MSAEKDIYTVDLINNIGDGACFYRSIYGFALHHEFIEDLIKCTRFKLDTNSYEYIESTIANNKYSVDTSHEPKESQETKKKRKSTESKESKEKINKETAWVNHVRTNLSKLLNNVTSEYYRIAYTYFTSKLAIIMSFVTENDKATFDDFYNLKDGNDNNVDLFKIYGLPDWFKIKYENPTELINLLDNPNKIQILIKIFKDHSKNLKQWACELDVLLMKEYLFENCNIILYTDLNHNVDINDTIEKHKYYGTQTISKDNFDLLLPNEYKIRLQDISISVDQQISQTTKTKINTQMKTINEISIKTSYEQQELIIYINSNDRFYSAFCSYNDNSDISVELNDGSYYYDKDLHCVLILTNYLNNIKIKKGNIVIYDSKNKYREITNIREKQYLEEWFIRKKLKTSTVPNAPERKKDVNMKVDLETPEEKSTTRASTIDTRATPMSTEKPKCVVTGGDPPAYRIIYLFNQDDAHYQFYVFKKKSDGMQLGGRNKKNPREKIFMYGKFYTKYYDKEKKKYYIRRNGTRKYLPNPKKTMVESKSKPVKRMVVTKAPKKATRPTQAKIKKPNVSKTTKARQPKI
jgi:hypothetical protein